MTQIIDFRNAKYQGQLLNRLPHGLGLMIDYKNLFCLAQWNQGVIQGKSLIVFGDSKIFYGEIYNRKPIGICTYHLKDKCQVFCNFENNIAPLKQTQQNIKNNKLVALLPTFNMIIKVEGQNQQQLQIKGQQVYRQNDFQSLKAILQKMLEWKFKQNQLQSYLSLENFIRNNFASKPQYAGLLDIVQIASQDGVKQMFLTLKNKLNLPSLGIKIQNCMQNSNSLTNLHNDGNSYIVKAVGYFTKQGTLDYGLKNIKTLIKGNIKQQAIYNDDKTIMRYEDDGNRPKQCSLNLLNHFKKSPNFVNDYLQIRHLSLLQSQCLNINFNIKETQTKKYAQLILENPKELSMQQRERIEETRLRKLHNGSIQKNVKNQNTPNPYKKQIQEYSQMNQQLQKVKQDIYRSVSKKKINGKSASPYVHGGTNLSSSPQKELKPAQLTHVKPILQIYKNTTQKSFYNSINNGEQIKKNQKHIDGYKFQLPKNIDSHSQTQISKSSYDLNQKKQNTSQSTDYFKNLQSRRRLYEEIQPSKQSIRRPNIADQPYKISLNSKKKFSYLPQHQPRSHIGENSTYRKNNSYSKLDDPIQLDRSMRNNSEYIDAQPSIYDPHRHYHDHFNPHNLNENYFKSQRRSPNISKSPQKQEGQIGKLGKRVQRKQRDNYQPIDSPYLNLNKKTSTPFDPIIVPQFKINHTNIPSQYKRSLQDEYTGPNPRRQHHLKYQNEFSDQRKSPLRSQQYRKEYLDNSPLKKVGLTRNTPQKYKNEHDVIMDPSVNFARQDLANKYSNFRQQRLLNENEYSLGHKQHQRSKSPLPRRNKILHDNPFDS